jgi:hypothetical protein
MTLSDLLEEVTFVLGSKRIVPLQDNEEKDPETP